MNRAGLYLITPPRIEPEPFAERLNEALRAAPSLISFVQLRLKPAHEAAASAETNDAIRAAVAVLMPVCRVHGARLILNDHPRLATELDCDGVHIGLDDPPCRQARAIVGPDKIVGVSCYSSLAAARQATEDGADYVAFGAFFPSRTKQAPRANPAPAILGQWRQESAVPAAAIGGVTADNGPALIQAGAAYLCTVGAIWGHPHGPAAAVREFDQAIATIKTPD